MSFVAVVGFGLLFSACQAPHQPADHPALITIERAVQISRLGTFIPALPADELAELRRRHASPASAQGSALWVDVRSAEAYHEEHVPGALPLQAAKWEAQLAAVVVAWTPGNTLVVYADHTDAGYSVAQRLHAQTELRPITVLEGGWDSAYPALQP